MEIYLKKKIRGEVYKTSSCKGQAVFIYIYIIVQGIFILKQIKCFLTFKPQLQIGHKRPFKIISCSKGGSQEVTFDQLCTN